MQALQESRPAVHELPPENPQSLDILDTESTAQQLQDVEEELRQARAAIAAASQPREPPVVRVDREGVGSVMRLNQVAKSRSGLLPMNRAASKQRIEEARRDARLDVQLERGVFEGNDVAAQALRQAHKALKGSQPRSPRRVNPVLVATSDPPPPPNPRALDSRRAQTRRSTGAKLARSNNKGVAKVENSSTPSVDLLVMGTAAQ